jgi:hypothetical protein
MSILSGRAGFAWALVAVCLGARAAHAQAGPVGYWIPGWPVGFGGNLGSVPSSNTYGDVPSFDTTAARANGLSSTRYHFPNGWFVGAERNGSGLSMSGINQNGAFGTDRSPYFEGVQLGYKFQNSGLPITVYAGFDTLKYDPGIAGPFSRFDSGVSTLPGYSAHAGIEFQPASDVSLSLGFGYSQQPGYLAREINSLSLPGASPFGPTGRR